MKNSTSLCAELLSATRLPFLVDEREARKRRIGVIAEIKPIVQELANSGMYVAESVLRNFLHEIGES